MKVLSKCCQCSQLKPPSQFLEYAGIPISTCKQCDKANRDRWDRHEKWQQASNAWREPLDKLEAAARSKQFTIDRWEDQGFNRESIEVKEEELSQIEAEIKRLRATLKPVPARPSLDPGPFPSKVAPAATGVLPAGSKPTVGGLVYLIQHRSSKLVKIGITTDWSRRSRQLGVGDTTEDLLLWAIDAPYHQQAEQALHGALARHRLPQSEWFHVDPAQAIRTMQRVMPRWEAKAQQHARASQC